MSKDSEKRMSLRERLAKMTPEELREALRRTAEGDRTHRADFLSQIVDDRAEALGVLYKQWDSLAAATEEMNTKHSEQKSVGPGDPGYDEALRQHARDREDAQAFDSQAVMGALRKHSLGIDDESQEDE